LDRYLSESLKPALIAHCQPPLDGPVRRFGFIFNAHAGRGRELPVVSQIAGRLREQGNETREYEFNPASPISSALTDGCSVIVACGGDGTASAVAAALRNTHLALAILPLGTLNHFSKDLGIATLAEAERVLIEGRVRTVDVGLLNDRTFINNSGIGIYPAIVLERERVRRLGVPKLPAFVLACVKAVIKLPFLHLRLEADGKRLSRVTPFLFVGNNVYETEGLSLGTRKRLDEGLLSAYVARHPGPLGLIRIALRALAGHLREYRDFNMTSARKLIVRTTGDSVLQVSLDGETYRMKTPLEYSILPGAIQVLAP
jgi:diacylglycerol kinase family enzyme